VSFRSGIPQAQPRVSRSAPTLSDCGLPPARGLISDIGCSWPKLDQPIPDRLSWYSQGIRYGLLRHALCPHEPRGRPQVLSGGPSSLAAGLALGRLLLRVILPTPLALMLWRVGALDDLPQSLGRDLPPSPLGDALGRGLDLGMRQWVLELRVKGFQTP